MRKAPIFLLLSAPVYLRALPIMLVWMSTAMYTPRIFAADNRVSPIISEVTVYRSGAKISSIATVKIPAGKSEVIFENLSSYFNPNSLQVKIKGGATLIAATFQLKTPGPAPESPRAPILRDSLIMLGDEFTRIRDEREVLGLEQAVIERKLDQIGTISDGANSSRTLSVAELRDLTSFYRQRLMEIKERLLQLVIKERKTMSFIRKQFRICKKYSLIPETVPARSASKLNRPLLNRLK